MTEVIKGITEEASIAIDKLLLNGKKIPAIRLYRTIRECTIGVAKDKMDARQVYLSDIGLVVMVKDRRYCDTTTDGKAWLAEHGEEPVKLNPKRHFYLYAKGHYEQGNTVKDLKKIASNYCGLERIRTEEIPVFLNSEVYPEVAKNEKTFSDFWKGCAPSTYKGMDDEEYYVRVIRKMLSILNLTKVREGGTILINLGKVDPNILPLRIPTGRIRKADLTQVISTTALDFWSSDPHEITSEEAMNTLEEYRLTDDVIVEKVDGSYLVYAILADQKSFMLFGMKPQDV